MKFDDEEETKSSTVTTSQLPPQLTPTPVTSLRLRNSLTLSTPLRTLSLPPIKNGRHSFVFPNCDATTMPQSSQLPPFDAGLTPIKSASSLCYTSLRDLMSSASSSAAMSTPASATPAMSSCYQIPIRNRLVKQAAWAYLQPMSSSSLASTSHSQLFFTQLWDCLSSWRPQERLIEYVGGHFLPAIQKILHRIRHAIRWLIAR